MDFDLGSILNAINFIIANKLVLGGVIGVFVGWNLPQPGFAKTIQDKVVSGLSWVWSKFKSNSDE